MHIKVTESIDSAIKHLTWKRLQSCNWRHEPDTTMVLVEMTAAGK